MEPSSRFRLLVIVLAALALFATRPVVAQQLAEATPYAQDELDELLAPIALYPDQLLTQVLVASTYPLEVVEAARFLQANPNLTGTALDDAVAQRNWDPSVQSLTAFPQVLAMLNDKLEWMERLGDAFLADEQRVMDTVQSLRRRAEAAGNLASMPQQTVVDRDAVIVIEPAQPDVVYVPIYDPLTVYGSWWAPGYAPWFWYPPPVYGYPAIFTGIAFGIGWVVGSNHWGWCHPDWRGHHVVLNTGRNRFWDRPNRPAPPPGQAWQHSPFHRRGVPYADAQTQQRFRPTSPDAIRQRQDYRGFAPAQRGVVEPARPQNVPGSRSPPSATPPGQSPTVANEPARAPAMARQPMPGAKPPGGSPPQPATPKPQAPVARPAQPPAATQPPAPVIRQAPIAPPIGAQRSSPSIFDPGLSRSQAHINAQRGVQSLHSTPSPASPAMMRAPSAPAAPAMHAPAAPARPGPSPAPRGR